MHKQHQAEKQSQIHTQHSQLQKGTSSERTSSASTPPTISPRESIERAVLADGNSILPSIDIDKLRATSGSNTTAGVKHNTVWVNIKYAKLMNVWQ